MPNRISSGGLKLPDSSFRSQAPAYAEVGRSLAGRAAELYEYASGRAAVAGESPLTPPNPQGLTGWDLSGPPWGSALRTSVAWFGGRSADTANSHRPAAETAWERVYRVGKPATIALRFWNRPHERLGSTAVAPLSRLYWVLRVQRLAGASTPTITLRTWNHRALLKRETANTTTFVQTVGDAQVIASTLWVPCVSGWNTVHLEASTTDTSLTAWIVSGALQNLVKRSH